jgi:hypothetical protein
LSDSFTSEICCADTGADVDHFKLKKQSVARLRVRGTSLAYRGLRAGALLRHTNSNAIMVSGWWLFWAFIVGGYAGMFLVVLIGVERKSAARDSAFE